MYIAKPDSAAEDRLLSANRIIDYLALAVSILVVIYVIALGTNLGSYIFRDARLPTLFFTAFLVVATLAVIVFVAIRIKRRMLRKYLENGTIQEVCLKLVRVYRRTTKAAGKKSRRSSADFYYWYNPECRT